MKAQPTLRAGIAALALSTVAGLTWGCVAEPPSQTAAPATTPSALTPSVTTPTPSPTATPTDDSVRDVSELGEPADYGTGTFPVSFFAAPGGSYICFIGTGGAGCQVWYSKPANEPTADEVCKGDREPVSGPQLLGSEPAAWVCRSDPMALPFLRGEKANRKNKALAWWDPTFGTSASGRGEDAQRLAVLPDGKTLVAGDFRCTSTENGATCENTSTGEGFRATRAKVDLLP